MGPGGQGLSIRTVTIEYGAIPTSSCLAHLDSTAAISEGLAQLRQHGQKEDGHCYVDASTIARCLELSEQHAKVLIDIVDAISDSHHLFVKRAQGHSEACAVDAYAIAQFLFAQLYIRQATRPEAQDVWPSPLSGMVAEVLSPFGASGTHPGSPGGPGLHPGPPNFFSSSNSLPSVGSGGPMSPIGLNHLQLPSFGSGGPSSPLPAAGSGHSDSAMPQSPARSNSSTSSQGTAPIQFQQQKSNQLVRRDLQAHLAQHSALLHGYADYIRRHAHGLLSLVLDSLLLGVHEGNFKEHRGRITAAEFDRIAFLLQNSRGQWSTDHPGSPMDISPTPFSDEGWRLSLGVPLFNNTEESSSAEFSDVADWLAENIIEQLLPTEALLASPGMSDGATLPLAGIVQGREVDIQGVCKSTVVRGEDDFPSGNLKIIDCHDSVIYALAPLQYAWVFCCSDCTVVIGAVARMLRVERCERLTVIAGSVRICINSCHDSTFYLGVNRPPLLIGDNRTLQLGPYNTQYERLPVHLAAAGIVPDVNLWDQPVTFTRINRQASPDFQAKGASGPATPGAQTRTAYQILQPEKLLPFMVPFQGGRGSMCGGAASGVTRLAADLGSFVGLGETGQSPRGPSLRLQTIPSGPFQLPQAYQEAKEQKVQAVADLRHHIKSTVLEDSKKRELQSTIQAYFKEWLTSTGKMREIYDLARMEREEGGSPRSPSSANHHF